MSFAEYPEYKESGIEWLGKVPEHWEIKSIRYILNAIGDVDHRMPESSENGVPYLMTGDLTDFLSNVRLAECKQVSRHDFVELSRKIKTSKGDVVMARYATIGTVMYIDIDIDILVSYSCVTLKTNPSQMSGMYLFQYIKSESFYNGIQNQINTNTQGNVGIRDLQVLKIAVPPIKEQNAIVEFLTDETAKIDLLIQEQERLIELLKEKRQAVISHAVTKGLDPTVKMKDSGIEWLGEVPEHWEILKLRHITKIINSGVSVNSVDVPAQDNEIGVLKTSAVYSNVFDPTKNKVVVFEDRHRVSCPVSGGTVIVSRMNTPELVGAAGFVKKSFENLYLPDRLWAITFQNVDPRFIHYYCCTIFYRAQVEINCDGTSSSMKNLSQDKFLNFPLTIPSLREQQIICEYLEGVIDKLDSLINKCQSSIDILNERRTSLISTAVTGQIDVRDFKPQAQAA
jgi:type I restriction enzyme S subunit